MRELEGGKERPGSLPGGVVWYAYRSCMRQVSGELFTGAPPSWLLGAAAGAAARRRPAPLPLAPPRRPLGARGCEVRLAAEALGAGSARCALRAFFHALRATEACLRARLASRLASFTRLRARLSSSLAIRTRWRATSASNRARSMGSADSPAGACAVDPAAERSVPLLAPDDDAPADRFAVAVLPMRNCGRWRGGHSVTQRPQACHRDFIHRFCE